MVANSAFPSATTVSQGLFADPSTYGLVQGSAYPDPSSRWRLRGGVLAQAETLPMYGGVLLYGLVPGGGNPKPRAALGSIVGRATALAGSGALAQAVGFSVFDQAYGMVQEPGNGPPLAGSGQQVMWYAFGSNARIAVAADPGLLSLQGSGTIGSPAAILGGGTSNYECGWDYVNQLLVPKSSSAVRNVATSTYNATTGEVVLALTAPSGLQPGDAFTVASIAGTGSFAALNIAATANPDTTESSISYTIATGLTLTTTPATGTVTYASSNILPVTLLDVQATNCLTIDYNIVDDSYQWNENGCAALIQI